ncbi:MAG TPA: class I SAM-dependent methyltransferase [Chitinispirillaceae bacterium]|nr:class I SAM-dependent methyltransferase [Chitinispirillaceae bacterium]
MSNKTSNEQVCRVCSNSTENTLYTFKDFHLGNNITYNYFQCSKCGCLQKSELFEEHVQYYPENYYSYAKDDRTTLLSKIKWGIRDVRNAYYRNGSGLPGKLIHAILPCMSIAMIEKCKPQKTSKILDIGCGSDALMLQYLSQQGYNNLFGVDPFIQKDIQISNASILKKSVLEIDDQFDLITLNHSFEHMPNPHEILKHLKKILSKNGRILLRIPVVDSFAWEHYRQYWPNLDAPRHLFLYSTKSIELLVKEFNLNIENKWYDSTAFQFWGTELYKKGYALHQKTLLFPLLKVLYRIYYSISKLSTIERLNENGKGDTVAFLLRNA